MDELELKRIRIRSLYKQRAELDREIDKLNNELWEEERLRACGAYYDKQEEILSTFAT